VVGVDATPDSRPAVEFAVRLAERRGSDLLAVHIYTEHAADILRRLGCRETEPAREAGARLLAECLTGQAERFPDLRIRPEVIRGWSPWTLVELSDSAQMIVVGRGEPGGRRRRGLGGCAIGLLRASSCPVAIVPAQVIPRRAGSVRTAPQPAESPHETPHGCATESHHPAGRAT
jgi:nucleotide-binding universal stress UspA family protein